MSYVAPSGQFCRSEQGVQFSANIKVRCVVVERNCVKGRLLSAKACFLYTVRAPKPGPIGRGFVIPKTRYTEDRPNSLERLFTEALPIGPVFGSTAQTRVDGVAPLGVSAPQMRATLLDYRASSPRALGCLRRKKCCRTAGCEANAAALNNRSVVVALFICRYLVYFELYGLLRSDDAAGILQRSVSGQGAMDCRGGATSSNVVAFRIASLNHPEASRRRRPRAARARTALSSGSSTTG